MKFLVTTFSALSFIAVSDEFEESLLLANSVTGNWMNNILF